MWPNNTLIERKYSKIFSIFLYRFVQWNAKMQKASKGISNISDADFLWQPWCQPLLNEAQTMDMNTYDL